MCAIYNLCFLYQIKECKYEYPYQIHKVPVQPNLFYHFIVTSSLVGTQYHIKENDDIAEIILKSMNKDSLELEDNDIVVIAQKIISKAEGCLVDLETITPSSESIKIAEKTDKDPGD